MFIEISLDIFEVWASSVALILSLSVSLIAITMTMSERRDAKYVHSGTLLIEFKNKIFTCDNLYMYKAIIRRHRKQELEDKDKCMLQDDHKMLDFLTEFEVMGSLVRRKIIKKQVLFDLFRPILLALKDDCVIQEFIKDRSENAGMAYFINLNYLCTKCKEDFDKNRKKYTIAPIKSS